MITLPKIKDDTDTIAAVKYALEKGFKNFIFFGCTGGRLSHTVANIQTLTYLAKHGATGYLTDKEEVATVTCKGINFDKDCTGFLSVFAVEGDTVISEYGLKYTLEHGILREDFPLGVSNEFIGEKAVLKVHTGSVLVILSAENHILEEIK